LISRREVSLVPNKPVTLAESNKKASIEISKKILDFNLKDGCELNEPVYDQIILTNSTEKKIKFKWERVATSSCELQFDPIIGSLDKGKSKTTKLKLILKEKTTLNFMVTLRVIGADSLFVPLRVSAGSGVFGVDPTTLELAEDNGLKVPKVLVDMKDFVLEHNGLNIEGIFRLAGEKTEINRIKDLMNRKEFDYKTGTKDVSAVANLIKIWYRDLPTPILNSSLMSDCTEREQCVDVYKALSEPYKTLLTWLLQLLANISANSEVNKMTAQNLAIVVAPNLYDLQTPNPMEGLIMSQKSAQFLVNVLAAYIGGYC